MKLLTCPVNGARNIAEFEYLGPARQTTDEDADSLIEHLFLVPNPIGVLKEWWRHTPSNTVFIAERHTQTDTVVTTYLPVADADKGN